MITAPKVSFACRPFGLVVVSHRPQGMKFAGFWLGAWNLVGIGQVGLRRVAEGRGLAKRLA